MKIEALMKAIEDYEIPIYYSMTLMENFFLADMAKKDPFGAVHAAYKCGFRKGTLYEHNRNKVREIENAVRRRPEIRELFTLLLSTPEDRRSEAIKEALKILKNDPEE